MIGLLYVGCHCVTFVVAQMGCGAACSGDGDIHDVICGCFVGGFILRWWLGMVLTALGSDAGDFFLSIAFNSR